MSKNITSVKQALSVIQKSIASKISKDINAVINLDLTGEGGGTWHLIISSGEVSLKEGSNKNSTSKIGVRTLDLIKIVNGDIDRRTIKITITGDRTMGMAVFE